LVFLKNISRIDFFFIFGCRKTQRIMKKISGILVIALLMIIAGCNKDKKDTNELVGTWRVYKYLYQNADETTQWEAAHGPYRITFLANGTFVEHDSGYTQNITLNGVNYVDTLYGINRGGTWAFANNYTHLILTDTAYLPVPPADTSVAPTLVQRNYTMFDLSGSNVQLDSASTSEYYYIKVM
jgi:hypothetical protein